jgi:branched-chain amino acid transport system ATP-binding protein
VTRAFGGLVAVNDVSFTIGRGQVYGLIGPNGAGKTTLINVISGLLPPTRGEITFNDTRLDGRPAHRVTALGLARTYQNIRLFGEMSCLENVLVGMHTRTRSGYWERLLFLPRVAREERAAAAQARALLDRVGLAALAAAPAASLPYGDQRRLEMARALATQPTLLLLDEPAAGMNPAERAALEALVRALAAEGLTILLIEHDMPLVMRVCDRVAVLNFGTLIAEGAPAAISRDPAVIEAYLGTSET